MGGKGGRNVEGGAKGTAEPVESATRPPRARCTAPCPCAHRTARPGFSRPANCHCERLLSCAWRSPYHVCTWVGNGGAEGEKEIQSVPLMSRGGIPLSMKSQAPATTKAVKLALPKHQPCQNFRRFRRAARSLGPDVGNGGNLAKARDLLEEKALHLLGRVGHQFAAGLAHESAGLLGGQRLLQRGGEFARHLGRRLRVHVKRGPAVLHVLVETLLAHRRHA